MSRIAGSIVIVCLLFVPVVIAIHETQYYDSNVDSYSGSVAGERRISNTSTRTRYFGIDYQKNLVNYGSKGPNVNIIYSSAFNLKTNSFSNRGRDPSKISNFDPNMRGFARLDVSVSLLPYQPAVQTIGTSTTAPSGTAKIFSTGNEYGSGSNKPYPKTQVFVNVASLPPVGDNEIYEAWLVDKETNYALSLGLLKSGIGLTSSLFFEISRAVHMFDSVMITKELYPDANPKPGEIVLLGKISGNRNIVKAAYFNEAFK